jgi:hypothetical protein
VQRSLLVVFAALALAGPAHASRYVQFGIQDDAWLTYGPGTLESRLERLNSVGVETVRYTLDWRTIEPRKGVYRFEQAEAILNGLQAHGIRPVVTIWGTPGWANGGRGPNWAPRSKWALAAFARESAQRFPFVTRWLIWNEPNQRRWLRPTSPKVYVQTLLNPAYDALHNTISGVEVGGGVTAPRAAAGGVSPVDWIRGMRAANARLDAYAHNPYPLSPQETPFEGGCRYCETITMSTLGRLLFEVDRAWGDTRIWLTEYGYQTNPPDPWLGVSKALQARYVSEAGLRVYEAPRVDLLIHYLVEDEPDVARWQSGLLTAAGAAKPSYAAFRLPLAEKSRAGPRTVVWGQVRPRSGPQRYGLQQFRAGSWKWIGGLRQTTARGFFSVSVRADRGALLRVWSRRDRVYSPVLIVR